ncbi:hypothetical protein ACWD4A_29920, partial [Streptomyces sp. NPDC002537]
STRKEEILLGSEELAIVWKLRRVLHALDSQHADRAELGFPPVSRMASVAGPPEAVADLIASSELPAGTEVLGPVPLPVTVPGRPRRAGDPPPGEHWERALLRVRPGQGGELAAALKKGRAARLARRDGEPVRLRIDPPDIG